MFAAAARKPTTSQRPKTKANYEKHKQKAAERRRKSTRAGQDIGPIPPPANLERKAHALKSLFNFGTTYFPHRFYLAPSADHITIVGEIDEALRQNGALKAFAMPRGSGKTSWCEVAVIYAAVAGLHKFTLLIGASHLAALELLQAIKEELSSNQLLAADFPEVCFPIACLEDRANRCKGQHSGGAKTKSVWSTAAIVLPTVAGSLASGAVIRVAGITGRIRGAKKDTLRPTLCIGDDLQTDSSAASAPQCEKRLRIVNGAMLGLGPPDRKITCIVPTTVIFKGDLADGLLDRSKSPRWTGRKFKLVYAFPTNKELWEQYRVLRADSFRAGNKGKEADEFYLANREAMDLGAVVAWPERHPDAHSGIQYAMNLLCDDEESFWAESQNEPLEADMGGEQLDKNKIAARVNNLPRGVAPLDATRLTAFIDVGAKVLWYVVLATSDDFNAAVIDYGAYPDQKRQYFTNADAQRTIAKEAKGAGLEGSIHAALTALSSRLLGRDWPRWDGQSLRVSQLLVDSGWQTNTVYDWCRQSPFAAQILPSHGRAVGAKNKPMYQYQKKPGERLGLNWLITSVAAKRVIRYAAIDVNFWKEFTRQRLITAVGDKGTLTIWGKAGQDHRMFADHCTAEYYTPVTANERTVNEWAIRPKRNDNHLWDCLVGAMATASIQGAALPEATEAKKKKGVSWSQQQRRRKAG